MNREPSAVREFCPRGAFVEELRNRLERRGLDVRAMAAALGIDRTRLHQVLSQATPPPGSEVVDRLADVLHLDEADRRWMCWLALRDRCDLPARALLEIYELALMDAWGTREARSIPERLGDQLELTDFVLSNRPIYLRHSTRPVFVHVHDEDGHLRESLVDGWIVRVEPAGMHGKEFLSLARDQLVLVNDRRRCRIGWLKPQKKGEFHLHGDYGQPLTTGRSPGTVQRGAVRRRLFGEDADEEVLFITKLATHRPYVGDIQALIPASTLKEIAWRRQEKLAQKVQSIRRPEHGAGLE